jgi:hypothetical protein
MVLKIVLFNGLKLGISGVYGDLREEVWEYDHQQMHPLILGQQL